MAVQVIILFLFCLLKSFQNKKGQKKIPGAPFSVSFSQLPAVEKDTEKWAAGKFIGPSYFETTLVMSLSRAGSGHTTSFQFSL